MLLLLETARLNTKLEMLNRDSRAATMGAMTATIARASLMMYIWSAVVRDVDFWSVVEMLLSDDCSRKDQQHERSS